MVKTVGLEKIDSKEVRAICEKQRLKPGRVKKTEGIQFTRGRNSNIEILDWNEFEEALRIRRLAVYASKPNKKGTKFMKIMKK